MVGGDGAEQFRTATAAGVVPPYRAASFKDVMREFMMGLLEMSVEFARGCRDVVQQSLVTEDSFLVRNFGQDSYIGRKIKVPKDNVLRRLRLFIEYFVPEDKDPFHAWSVILFVFVLALAGIPGLKASVLEEFGVQLLTYDLPGFGESDCHPYRNLKSSASDMLFLANALGVADKFWVVGYSTGSLHALAALRYIPDRVAGAALFAPMVNPYDSLMNWGEKYEIWEKWTRKRKFLYFLARRFPKFLSYFYRQSFLSGKHGRIDQWLALTLGGRDRALIEDPIYEEFWQRDVEESIRQRNAKPFMEEAVLQVSNWGFSLADLKLQKKQRGKSILNVIKSLISGSEEYTGFLGPIHIWQGMDDKVVPPSMTDFVHRVLPSAAVHKLPYEGHFTYLYFCNECHRQIFATLFGTPQGPRPLVNTIEVEQTSLDDIEVQENAIRSDFKTD